MVNDVCEQVYLFRWNGIHLFFQLLLMLFFEHKSGVDPDPSSKRPLSSSSPAYDEESVSLGNNPPSHNSKSYSKHTDVTSECRSLGYSCIWYCGYCLHRLVSYSTELSGDVPSGGWLASFCTTLRIPDYIPKLMTKRVVKTRTEWRRDVLTLLVKPKKAWTLHFP